eukprot:TRINITY_DN10271_c0_g1_i1.p1 TRINITY_DN10271_c0_g1~~TRINITY_DN10271_c0_g1_i1.p1  ORF type:complete len:161 (+),score=37.95 TRINITY_DN10271_c0_g1_i1:35-517(+)
MIKKIVEDYEKKKIELQKEREKLKEENVTISKNLTKVFIQEVNQDVSIIHRNQKKIVQEIIKLKENTQELIKQSENWVSLYSGLSQSLKEAGDITNWYLVLEKRLNHIKDNLRSAKSPVDTGKKGESSSESQAAVESTNKIVKIEEIAQSKIAEPEKKTS